MSLATVNTCFNRPPNYILRYLYNEMSYQRSTEDIHERKEPMGPSTWLSTTHGLSLANNETDPVLVPWLDPAMMAIWSEGTPRGVAYITGNLSRSCMSSVMNYLRNENLMLCEEKLWRLWRCIELRKPSVTPGSSTLLQARGVLK